MRLTPKGGQRCKDYEIVVAKHGAESVSKGCCHMKRGPVYDED